MLPHREHFYLNWHILSLVLQWEEDWMIAYKFGIKCGDYHLVEVKKIIWTYQLTLIKMSMYFIESVIIYLSWIIFVTGLIEFGLTDQMSVHAFYYHLYMLLENDRLVCLYSLFVHFIATISLQFNLHFCYLNRNCRQLERKYNFASALTRALNQMMTQKLNLTAQVCWIWTETLK